MTLKCLSSILIALVAGTAHGWPSRPEILVGRIVNVDDGDTVTLLAAGNERVKIRLSSIDAPETSHTAQSRGRVGQPYSSNARAFLQDLVKGQSVEAHCIDVDRYERRVCEIFVNHRSANSAMVQAGWAWANQASGGRYLRDRQLIELEATARKSHLGLWAGARPVAPWIWRRNCWEQGDCPS